MTAKLQSIIRKISRERLAGKWPRLRPFYLVPRKPAVAAEEWVEVYATSFEEGGADGDAFPDMTGVWPAGVTVIGDWSYAARVDSAAAVGKGVRFPKLSEAGSGSNHSLYRVQHGWTNAALVTAGILTRGRASWRVKIPATGGVQYRTSGASEYWCSCLWQMDDMSSLTNIVAFDTPTQLCCLKSVNRAAAWNAITADGTLDISGYAGAGWHEILVEWQIGAAGSMKVTWDNAVSLDWSGNNALLESGIKLYLMAPGGRSATNWDLSYYGGMDEVKVWRHV